MGKKLFLHIFQNIVHLVGQKETISPLLRGEFAYHKVGKGRLIQSFMDSNIY